MPVFELAGACRKGCTGPVLRNIQRLGRLGRMDCRSAPKDMLDSLPLTTASSRKMPSKDSRYGAVACLPAFILVTQLENQYLAFAAAAAAAAASAAASAAAAAAAAAAASHCLLLSACSTVYCTQCT